MEENVAQKERRSMCESVLIKQPEGKRQFGNPRRECENGIKFVLQK